jgi:hypothetical protein
VDVNRLQRGDDTWTDYFGADLKAVAKAGFKPGTRHYQEAHNCLRRSSGATSVLPWMVEQLTLGLAAHPSDPLERVAVNDITTYAQGGIKERLLSSPSVELPSFQDLMDEIDAERSEKSPPLSSTADWPLEETEGSKLDQVAIDSSLNAPASSPSIENDRDGEANSYNLDGELEEATREWTGMEDPDFKSFSTDLDASLILGDEGNSNGILADAACDGNTATGTEVASHHPASMNVDFSVITAATYEHTAAGFDPTFDWDAYLNPDNVDFDFDFGDLNGVPDFSQQ